MPDGIPGKCEGFESQVIRVMYALGEIEILLRLVGRNPIKVYVPSTVATDLLPDLRRNNALNHVGRIPARFRSGVGPRAVLVEQRGDHEPSRWYLIATEQIQEHRADRAFCYLGQPQIVRCGRFPYPPREFEVDRYGHLANRHLSDLLPRTSLTVFRTPRLGDMNILRLESSEAQNVELFSERADLRRPDSGLPNPPGIRPGTFEIAALPVLAMSNPAPSTNISVEIENRGHRRIDQSAYGRPRGKDVLCRSIALATTTPTQFGILWEISRLNGVQIGT